MEGGAHKLSRLDSQVSVDAAPDGIRSFHKSPFMPGGSLSSRDVSMDALPRNDPVPQQIRTNTSNSSLHPEFAQSIMLRESAMFSSSAPSDSHSHQGYSSLCKSVQDKIQFCVSSTVESLDEESLPLSISESCSSEDDDSWLKYLEVNEKFMPPDIKIGYYDVMVLYSEENQKDAHEFCQHLRSEITLKNGESVKAVLYDCEELTSLDASKLKHLEKSLERCTYVFIFMTKEFCEDKWMALSSEECLMKAIYDEEKRWCVVPVYTVSRRNAKFKIPMGLNSLKGINYYNNDQFYRNGVSRLIEDKLYQRLKNEKMHRDKQYKWLQQHIRQQVTEKENRKRLEYMEKLKTEQHELEEKRKTKDFVNQDLNQQHPMSTSDLGNYYPAMHYSYSEPGLQNKFYSSPYSASSDCLVQVDAKGQPYFVQNFNSNPCSMPYFQTAMVGNANIMENVDPCTRMNSSAVSEYPSPCSSQLTLPPQYYEVMAASQGQPSQQGQIQPLGYNQQLKSQPAQFSLQVTNQMYQQNPNLLPLSKMHDQLLYTQSAMNPQQTQTGAYFNKQQILNQSGLGVQQLDHFETQNTGLGPDLNMQQTVNQTAVSTSATYLQGGKPVEIPLQNRVGQRENNIEGNPHSNHISIQPQSCGNEAPLNNSPLSADQLSQLGSTNEMETTAEVEDAHKCIPVLSLLGQNLLTSLPASSCSGDEKSGVVVGGFPKFDNLSSNPSTDGRTLTLMESMGSQTSASQSQGLPNFDALSLNDPSMDGRTLTLMESMGSQTSASQSQGGITMPVNLLKENTSHSAPSPDNNKTDIAESVTETIRKTKEDGEKVIIHHHYHYYEEKKDEPKVINIYDAKTVQIGDKPTVIESKKLQNKSKSSKELQGQKEKTNVKFQSTLHDVARKEIEEAESQTCEDLPVSAISELKAEHASVANQHNSRESEDFLSIASRASPELKKSPSNKKDEEKEKHSLRTKSKDHNSMTVMEEKKDTHIGSIPYMEKKSEPIHLGTKPQIKSKPIATVPPSPSVVQNQPFKKATDNDNEETVLKSVGGREQSDDTRLKTVHESRGRPVHETEVKTVHETESEETTLKLSAPQRATNMASPFREGSHTDNGQNQASIQQRTPNSASSVRERWQRDLGMYQPTMRSTGPLFAKAYPFSVPAVASSSQSDETSAVQRIPLGEDLPSQDELDEDTSPDGGPPKSEGFVPNIQENKEEWLYLDTDSFDTQDPSVLDSSNPRRRKKANSSSTDIKSCTLS
ncbi:hypothetical protein ACJMK2_043155 [Sinanodonta woodiana]|uniref:TIR domain-containing protein n=1 Tax=Sinanodonta woodiana TaxID=1069815 RepID=A0ABD3VW15_SINWO